MPLHVSSKCAHHQEVKIALHSLWYHHTYRWPSRAHLCTRRPPISGRINVTVTSAIRNPDRISWIVRKKKGICVILVCKQIEWNWNCFEIWYRGSLEIENEKTSWLCGVAANPSARIEFKQASTRLLTAHRRSAVFASMGACMNSKWRGSVTRILFRRFEKELLSLQQN